jgi:hypothetical protein
MVPIPTWWGYHLWQHPPRSPCSPDEKPEIGIGLPSRRTLIGRGVRKNSRRIEAARLDRDKLGDPFGRRPPRPPQFETATPASERICVKQSFRSGKLDVSHRVAHSSSRCAPKSR